MKLIKVLSVAVALAGMAVLALAFTRSAYGESQPDQQWMPDRQWIQELTLLQGSGSQIGVTARDLETAEAERLNVQGAVMIEEVRADSPAATAGFKASDIVVEFDGERIRSLRQFSRLVQETPPGRTVKAVVVRNGRRSELSVTPTAGSWSDFSLDRRQLRDHINAFRARIPFDFNLDFDLQTAAPRLRLGVTAQELTPDLAAYFGTKDGVLVASVVADSPASRAGLKAGDVITSVDGQGVTSRNDLVRELRKVGGDGDVTLGIVRDKKESTLKAKIDVQSDRRARPARPIRPINATSV